MGIKMKVRKKTVVKKERVKRNWDENVYVDVYILARSGLKDSHIRQAMGIHQKMWERWLREKPGLRYSLKKGREEPQEDFGEYVYKRLSPKLQVVWDEINGCEDDEKEPFMLESSLKALNKHKKQKLFLHAISSCNFNQSEACRKIGVTQPALLRWIREDKKFAELLKEMEWHKGNFYEEGLVRLVGEGDTAATIFANRTFNRERGYDSKVSLTVNGEIKHSHQHMVEFDKLDLSVEVRRAVLEAIEKREKELDTPKGIGMLEHKPEVLEGVAKVVENPPE